MRIRSIHLHGVGPFEGKTISFEDTWRSRPHTLTLLSGANGCGKSTVLRAASHLWQVAAQWLAAPGKKSKPQHPSHRWLRRWRAVGMILEDVQGHSGPMGLFFGDPLIFSHLESMSDQWLGETRDVREGPGKRKQRLLHSGEPWVEEMARGYKKLVLTADESSMPNLLHLDAEERRWVAPTRGLGEVLADDPALRWQVSYRATEEWKGQLESSLINLRTTKPKSQSAVLEELNAFLKPKKIEPVPESTTMRLQVQLPGRKGSHTLDDLSAGEHQVLIQLYLISRWLQPGGVVLIDEPDLHLHPSLLGPFMTRLEHLVAERSGQLIITSHNTDLWQRYETKGHRINLGGES